MDWFGQHPSNYFIFPFSRTCGCTYVCIMLVTQCLLLPFYLLLFFFDRFLCVCVRDVGSCWTCSQLIWFPFYCVFCTVEWGVLNEISQWFCFYTIHSYSKKKTILRYTNFWTTFDPLNKGKTRFLVRIQDP